MMTGLVEQLQAQAMDGSVPIADLLRKAKVVAVKLRQNEIAGWLESEMSGYKDGSALPDYRKLGARAQFFNPVRGWCPIVGGDHLLPVGQSVGEIAKLAAGDGDTLEAPAPASVARHVSQELGFDVDVRRLISKAAMAGILEEVRNQILHWALELEQAGIHGAGLSFSPSETARAQSVVVNIGSIGNATGIGAFGNNAAITATVSGDVKVMAQKVLDLVGRAEKALPNSALSKDAKKSAAKQLAELKEEASGSKPSEGKLKKGLAALRRIMEGSASDLIAAGIGAAISGILGG